MEFYVSKHTIFYYLPETELIVTLHPPFPTLATAIMSGGNSIIYDPAVNREIRNCVTFLRRMGRRITFFGFLHLSYRTINLFIFFSPPSCIFIFRSGFMVINCRRYDKELLLLHIFRSDYFFSVSFWIS